MIAAFVAWLCIGVVAQAADVYVNGQPVDSLREFEFEAVNVRIDKNGDVWIDAPQYRVTLGESKSGKKKKKKKNMVASAKYWLVTEDNDSSGQDVDVLINGRSIRRVRSGDAQLILDVGPYLQRGSNAVTFNPKEGGELGGGALFIYLGTGSNQSGTVKLDRPQISYKRSSAGAPDNSPANHQLTAD